MVAHNPVTAVSAAVKCHEAMREALQDVYDNLDPQALLDTIEGETDLTEVLQQVASQALEYETLAKATQERIEALQARKARTLKAAETLRSIVLQAMDTTGRDKISGPEITLSVAKRRGSLVIDDESLVPACFFKPQPPKLDKKALTEAAREGEQPGCHIGNGSISLTIRVK